MADLDLASATPEQLRAHIEAMKQQKAQAAAEGKDAEKTAPKTKRAKKETETAPVKEADPVAVEAEKVDAADVVDLTQVPSLFGGNSVALPSYGGDLLDRALAAVSSENKTLSPFHTLMQDGANSASGGGLKAAPWTDESVALELPEGPRGFFATFMGYRVTVTGWPEKFDSASTKKAKPVFTASASTGDDLELIVQAASAYQFCGDKKRFDYHSSGDPAHIRPQVEIMLHIQGQEKPIIVATPSHFSSVTETLKAINGLKRPGPDGKMTLQALPVRVLPKSKDVQGKNNTWKTHWISFESDPSKNTDALKAEWDAYRSYVAINALDPEAVKEVGEWLDGADRPITDNIRDTLQATVDARR